MNKIVNLKMLSVMAVVLTFLSLVTFVPTEAQAYSKPPIFGRLQRGVGNIHYTVNEGAERFTPQINAAVQNWMYTGWDNPIYMSPVSSREGSDVDFWEAYGEWFTQQGVQAEDGVTIGYTFTYGSNEAYIKPSESNPPSWYYAKIVMNLELAAQSFWEGSIRHEMGHGFGLAHSTDVNSIMCQVGVVGQGRAVQTVQQGDSDRIVDIYGM